MKRIIVTVVAVIALLGCADTPGDVETSEDVVAAPSEDATPTSSAEVPAPSGDDSPPATGDVPEPAPESAGGAPTSTAPSTSVAPTVTPPSAPQPPPPPSAVPAPEDPDLPPPTTAPEATTPSLPVATTIPRHEEAPHLFDLLADEDPEGPFDFVIVREGPGGDYRETTRIEAPIMAMEGTGRVQTDDEGITWRELRLGRSQTGWVQLDRLAINSDAAVSTYDYRCADSGVQTGSVPISAANTPTSADGERPADHIAQMWQLIGPGCDRLHIAFGSGGLFGEADLAHTLPDDVSVEAYGNWARISLGDIEGARFDATIDTEWRLSAVAAAPASGGIVVDVFASQPSTFAARTLANPARLILDVIPTDGDMATDELTVIQSDLRTTMVVRDLAPGETESSALTPPHTVRGYSSWFESAGLVNLTDLNGTPVTGTLSGERVVNPGTGSEWGVTATRWLDGWGTFEFTLESIDADAGDYLLTVTDYCPRDDPPGCGPMGVVLRFTHPG